MKTTGKTLNPLIPTIPIIGLAAAIYYFQPSSDTTILQNSTPEELSETPIRDDEPQKPTFYQHRAGNPQQNIYFLKCSLPSEKLTSVDKAFAELADKKSIDALIFQGLKDIDKPYDLSDPIITSVAKLQPELIQVIRDHNIPLYGGTDYSATATYEASLIAETMSGIEANYAQLIDIARLSNPSSTQPMVAFIQPELDEFKKYKDGTYFEKSLDLYFDMDIAPTHKILRTLQDKNDELNVAIFYHKNEDNLLTRTIPYNTYTLHFRHPSALDVFEDRVEPFQVTLLKMRMIETKNTLIDISANPELWKQLDN